MCKLKLCCQFIALRIPATVNISVYKSIDEHKMSKAGILIHKGKDLGTTYKTTVFSSSTLTNQNRMVS